MKIYVVCDSSEGVSYAVGIQAIYVDDREAAIQKCQELGFGFWVWEFNPGENYADAREIFPEPE